MARRTTSKKGPPATGKATVKSDPSPLVIPTENDETDNFGSLEGKKSSQLAAADDTSSAPEPEQGSATSEQANVVSASDESDLSKDEFSSAQGTESQTPPEQEREASESDTAPDAAAGDTETPPDIGAPAEEGGSSPTTPDVKTEDTAPESGTAAQTTPRANTAATPAPSSKGSMFPVLLGGVLAGAIGYAAAFVTAPQGVDPSDLAQLRAEVASLRSAFDAAPDPVDSSAIEAEIAALRDQIAAFSSAADRDLGMDMGAELEQLRALIGAGGEVDLAPLQARLTEVSESTSQLVAQVTDELSSFRAALGHTEEQISALGADVADLRDLSERRVFEAEAAIDAAMAQSGLDSLRAALETGVPYPDAVARLSAAGVTVPEALAAAAPTGIATIEALQESFPEAARGALRVALQDAPAESTVDRLGNFLRAQTGARSTVPRAGDDPDAILSRVGAAIEAGDIDAALLEVDALPAPAQAAMADWLAAARARLAARDALPELIHTISTE